MPPNEITKLYGSPRVGGDALSYCTRCKIELAHIIVSMVDQMPAKVICKTCKGQHSYKRQTTLGGKTRKPRGSRVTKVKISVSELWEQKLAEKNKEDSHPYAISHVFNPGSVIQHGKFGLGIVEKIQSSNKILVLFRGGEKILVHGLKQR